MSKKSESRKKHLVKEKRSSSLKKICATSSLSPSEFVSLILIYCVVASYAFHLCCALRYGYPFALISFSYADFIPTFITALPVVPLILPMLVALVDSIESYYGASGRQMVFYVLLSGCLLICGVFGPIVIIAVLYLWRVICDNNLFTACAIAAVAGYVLSLLLRKRKTMHIRFLLFGVHLSSLVMSIVVFSTMFQMIGSVEIGFVLFFVAAVVYEWRFWEKAPTVLSDKKGKSEHKIARFFFELGSGAIMVARSGLVGKLVLVITIGAVFGLLGFSSFKRSMTVELSRDGSLEQYDVLDVYGGNRAVVYVPYRPSEGDEDDQDDAENANEQGSYMVINLDDGYLLKEGDSSQLGFSVVTSSK